MASLKYWLWLTTRPGLGIRAAWRVVEQFGSPEGAYFASAGEYNYIQELSAVAREGLCQKDLSVADRILGDCDRLGIHILTCQDADYPERLRNIIDRPQVLYCKGKKIAFDEEVAIGVVGTRKCTPYGARVAGKLGLDLARNGAVLVSGIAEGIDSAAVRGALKGGGRVVCVLGGGIDRKYPAVNRDLYDDVAAVGLLVSEYPPGTEHKAGHFPVRNRILSGLSVGVVVVESPLKGGALLTAEHAMDQDRDLFAVPGPVDSPASGGANRLIRLSEAKLTEKVWDILEEYVDRFPGKLGHARLLSREEEEQRLESALNRVSGKAPPAPPAPAEEPEKVIDKRDDLEYIDWKEQQSRFTDDQRAILLELGARPLPAEDLIELTGIPTRRVLSALTLLQVQGYVAETPEKRFAAKVRLKME